MRSKILKKILDETPREVEIFVKKYGDLLVRVHQILKEKGISQKVLAERLGKTPSEISKWLSGNHNLTMRSLAKLEAELEVDLIYIPKRDSFHVQMRGTIRSSVTPQRPLAKQVVFIPASEGSNRESLTAMTAS